MSNAMYNNLLPGRNGHEIADRHGYMEPTYLVERPYPSEPAPSYHWADNHKENLGMWLRRFKLEEPIFEKKLESFGLSLRSEPGELLVLVEEQIASTGLYARTVRQMIACMQAAGITKPKLPEPTLEHFSRPNSPENALVPA